MTCVKSVGIQRQGRHTYLETAYIALLQETSKKCNFAATNINKHTSSISLQDLQSYLCFKFGFFFSDILINKSDIVARVNRHFDSSRGTLKTEALRQR